MYLCVCRAQETFLQWDQCRRLYNFVLAGNMKKLVLSHRWNNRFCSYRLIVTDALIISRLSFSPVSTRNRSEMSVAWIIVSFSSKKLYSHFLFGSNKGFRFLAWFVWKPLLHCSHRSSLLSMNSSNIGDADLSRLYAATSLTQIDDSIMRWSLLGFGCTFCR